MEHDVALEGSDALVQGIYDVSGASVERRSDCGVRRVIRGDGCELRRGGRGRIFVRNEAGEVSVGATRGQRSTLFYEINGNRAIRQVALGEREDGALVVDVTYREEL